MRKRVIIVLAVVCVVLAGVVGWQVVKPSEEPEPIYKGRKLSEWLRDWYCETNYSGPLAAEGKEAVREAGTNAIPTLLRMVRVRDSALKTKMMSLLARQHVIKIQFTPARIWNCAATMGSYMLRADARAAVPELIEIARQNISPASQSAAIDFLGHIGPPAKEALPWLRQWLTNSDAEVRFEANRAIPLIEGITRYPPP